MDYVVLDFEFNQAFPFATGRKSVPVSGCLQEIIEIGAVMLDENLAEKDSRRFWVRPRLYPRLHPYVKRITGIKKDDLRDAPIFKQVYGDFAKFCGGGALCFWGPDDLKALFENVAANKLDMGAIPRRYINVQRLCDAVLSRDGGRQISLKDAVGEFCPGASFGGYHDALNDAKYTAEVFRRVWRDDIEIMTYEPPPAKQARAHG